GASATVFGARGASSFLSKSTAILATLFMVMSLGMAVYASRMNAPSAGADDLGVMEGLEAPAVPVDATVPTLAPNATDVPAGAQVPQASPAAPAAGEAGTDAPAAAAQPQGNGAAAPAAAGSAEAAPADVDADPAPAADAPVQDGNGG